MKPGYICKVCGGDMYEVMGDIKCETCDASLYKTREERIKELELEYEDFIKTDKGKEWLDYCRSRGNGWTGDCGDYLYDFYPEVLM